MAKQSIAERKAALEAELAKIKEEEKQLEETMHAVIGRVVSKEMDNNSDLKQQIEQLLEQTLTKNTERDLFGLEKLQSNRGRRKMLDNEVVQ